MIPEQINICLYLNTNWWNQYPEYNVYLDDKKIDLDKSLTKSWTPFQRKFITEPLDKGYHQLEIEFIKDNNGTFYDNEGRIVRQTSLMIFNVSFNNFLLKTKNLLNRKGYTLSNGIKKYVDDQPIVLLETSKFVLEFESPFAYWAVKEM